MEAHVRNPMADGKEDTKSFEAGSHYANCEEDCWVNIRSMMEYRGSRPEAWSLGFYLPPRIFYVKVSISTSGLN